MKLIGTVKAVDTRYVGAGATVHVKDGRLGFCTEAPFELEFHVTTTPEDLERWRVGRRVEILVTALEDTDAKPDTPRP
jgi:hypothetical protein